MSASSTRRAPGVTLRSLADAELRQAMRRQGFHLQPQALREFMRLLEREPTLAELALVDAMWSEHCSYKSTRALLRRLPLLCGSRSIAEEPAGDDPGPERPTGREARPGC